MTDIGVHSTTYQIEDLSWDLSQIDVPYVEGGTLDLSLFTQAQHFAKGYIPSGTVLGQNSTTKLLGPYLGTATDGRQTAVGILRASISVIDRFGGQITKVGGPVLKAFGVVDVARLPFTSTNAAAGGFYDTAAATDLAHLHFKTV